MSSPLVLQFPIIYYSVVTYLIPKGVSSSAARSAVTGAFSPVFGHTQDICLRERINLAVRTALTGDRPNKPPTHGDSIHQSPTTNDPVWDAGRCCGSGDLAEQGSLGSTDDSSKQRDLLRQCRVQEAPPRVFSLSLPSATRRSIPAWWSWRCRVRPTWRFWGGWSLLDGYGGVEEGSR